MASTPTLHHIMPAPYAIATHAALTQCHAAQGLQSAQTDREAAISAGQYRGDAHRVQVRVCKACLEAVYLEPPCVEVSQRSLSRRPGAVSQAAAGLHEVGGDAQQEREEDQQPLGPRVGVAEHAAAAGLLRHHPQRPAGEQTQQREMQVAMWVIQRSRCVSSRS